MGVMSPPLLATTWSKIAICCFNLVTSLSSALFRASSCFKRSFARVITSDFEGLVRATFYKLGALESGIQIEYHLQSEDVSKRYKARSAILSFNLSR